MTVAGQLWVYVQLMDLTRDSGRRCCFDVQLMIDCVEKVTFSPLFPVFI